MTVSLCMLCAQVSDAGGFSNWTAWQILAKLEGLPFKDPSLQADYWRYCAALAGISNGPAHRLLKDILLLFISTLRASGLRTRTAQKAIGTANTGLARRPLLCFLHSPVHPCALLHSPAHFCTLITGLDARQEACLHAYSMDIHIHTGTHGQLTEPIPIISGCKD